MNLQSGSTAPEPSTAGPGPSAAVKDDVVIRYEGVCKRFGDKVVLQDLDLAVKQGETLAIMGPSGIGKSVTLRHAVGLLHADSGRVLVEGHDMATIEREDLIALRARVRLCKGAYLEPPSVAFPDKADVDRNYVKLMQRLLSAGNHPGLATHDKAIIGQAREFAGRERIGTDRYEFQMLYGVRRDLQTRLRRAGHNMRVYIPFGTQWYPYLMRRLAERPANIAFFLGNMVKESLPGR